jgi:hypothetical protein
VFSLPCPKCATLVQIADGREGEFCPACGQYISVAPPAAPPEERPDFAGITGDPSPFVGLRNPRSEELWSNYGRDALFLAFFSYLMMALSCLLSVVGILLAGGIALIALILAIRAIVIAGNRSQKGLAFAITALVLSLVPLGLGLFAVLGWAVSLFVR